MADNNDFIKEGLEDFLKIVEKNFPENASSIGELVKYTTDNLDKKLSNVSSPDQKNNFVQEGLSDFKEEVRDKFPKLSPLVDELIQNPKEQFKEAANIDTDQAKKEQRIARLRRRLDSLRSSNSDKITTELEGIIREANEYGIVEALASDIAMAQEVVGKIVNKINTQNYIGDGQESEEEKDKKKRQNLLNSIAEFHEKHKDTHAEIDELMDKIAKADPSTEEGKKTIEEATNKGKEIKKKRDKDGTTKESKQHIEDLTKDVKKLEKKKVKEGLSEDEEKHLKQAKKELETLEKQDKIFTDFDKGSDLIGKIGKANNKNDQERSNVRQKVDDIEKILQKNNNSKDQDSQTKNTNLQNDKNISKNNVSQKINDIEKILQKDNNSKNQDFQTKNINLKNNKNISKNVAKDFSKNDLAELNKITSAMSKINKNTRDLNDDNVQAIKPKAFKKPSAPSKN